MCKGVKQYCEENGIDLKKDYSNERMTRDTIIEATCLNCDSVCSKVFRQFIKVGCYCEIHTKENKQQKAKATNLEKYGCENPLQNEEVRDKVTATNLEKYGCENPFQNEEIKDKMKATCLKKYGVENPMKSKEVREKSKTACLKKYGVENPSQNKEVRDKTKSDLFKEFWC